MSRESTLLLLGVLAALLPFLGLPYLWLMILLPPLGLAVVLLAIAVRARRMTDELPSQPAPASPDETHALAP